MKAITLILSLINLILMQREVARRKFNSEPVTCNACTQTYPNYRMVIDKANKVRCVGCSSKSPEHLLEIRQSYKEYYENLIKKLPLPDYKIAYDCLQTVGLLRRKTNDLLEEIRKKLSIFENELKDYLEQTVFICQGYIDKVKQIEESNLQNWHNRPPKLIEQERFIYNIKQKQQLALKIQQSLKELKFSLPDIDHIKKENEKLVSKRICNRVSITSAIPIRGVLYQGTNDGKIIYEDSHQLHSIPAHDSLIRDFEHDGQFTLFSSSDDQVIKMWNIRELEPKLEKSFGIIPGIRSSHRQLALVDRGKCLASTRGQFDEYKIRIWDLQSFQNTKTLVGHRGYIKGIVVTEDDQLITVSEDRYLKIWDLKSCEPAAEYFHTAKLTHVLYSSQHQLICIIDDLNKVQLLDLDSLRLFNGVCTGRKVQAAAADTYIYVHNDRFLNIYSWNLSLIEKADLGLSYAATNIIEMFNKLIITDANGSVHEFSPLCLKNTNM